ncbi:hypothetical protein [Synechococcus sp. CC9616]|jgi:hypothetical protein|uniref:hypothetical protein n=1 Tax=Synechococcus sp. CC9616 TaxID=110663 RepID=UPI0004BC40FC|nr:hypothetical protein [Synechococcus sp. CC9616]
MILRTLRLELRWPLNIPASGLRSLIKREVADQDHWLRWALTAVTRDADGQRILQLEAVTTE